MGKIRDFWFDLTMSQRLVGIGILASIIAATALLLVHAFGRPDYLRIANLSEYTVGRPANEEEVRRIEESLFATVNKYKRVRSNGVKDFLIREGTFNQRDDDDYHLVKFLIDSESLQQSYAVSYQWGNRNKFEQYVGMIVCVQPNQVIYQSFRCQDPLVSAPLPAERANLDDYIPYSTEHFEVRSDMRTSPISIIITVSLNDSDLVNADETYYQEALSWLNSTKLDLGKYMLVKRVIRPTVQK
jgi:hypothetical protein